MGFVSGVVIGRICSGDMLYKSKWRSQIVPETLQCMDVREDLWFREI